MAPQSTPNRDKRAHRRPISQIPVIQTDVAGIDLGSKRHFVCAPHANGKEVVIENFGATTPQLLELSAWLKTLNVRSVAMESTGVYWVPIYDILEQEGFDVRLVNSRELKHVPGRKTDVSDCEWIQRLHSCGLLKRSFRPSEDICCIRSLMRDTLNLIQLRTKSVHHMQKALDQMNVLVHRAVSDITGETGMRIIRAIATGERDPQVLASFRNRRCRKSEAEIAEHLQGNWRREHIFSLVKALQRFDHVNEQLLDYDQMIQLELAEIVPEEHKDLALPSHPNPSKMQTINRDGNGPIHDLLFRFAGVDLTQLPGINIGCTQVVLSEVGSDLSAFPTEGNWVGWLRLKGAGPQSGGKHLKKKKKRSMGANRIAEKLRMGASSLLRSDTALGAEFRRYRARLGHGGAIHVVARKLAILIYRLLKYGHEYVEIGAEAYDARFAANRLKRLKTHAAHLGYELTALPTSAPA